MPKTKLPLARLEGLLLTACDDLRGNMDASELHRQKLGLMQDLLAGKVPVKMTESASEPADA